MAVHSNPARSLLQGGNQNEIPVTFKDNYANFTMDFGRDYCLENRVLSTVTPSYHALDIRGSSTAYTNQRRHFGEVNMTITFSRSTSYGGPTYEHIFYDGVEYVIQVGISVAVPRCVFDTINSSDSVSAVLTPNS